MQAIKKKISKFWCLRADDIDENESQTTSYEAEPLSDFQLTLLCFRLKRDLERMLDIPRLFKMYGHEEEKPPFANMEVRNMSEFL